MINSKAIKVLKTFNELELRQFGKFVRSPFHNNNKNITKLFLFLKKHYPDFNSTNESIYRHLFRGKKYNYDVVKHLFADLYKVCEDFIAHDSLNSDSFAGKSYVLKKFNEKKLDNLFLLNARKMNEGFIEEKIGYDYYRKKSQLESEQIKFLLLRNKQHKISESVLKRGEYYMVCILNWIDQQISDVNVQRQNYGKLKEPDLIEAFLGRIDLKGFSDWLQKNMSSRYVYIAIYVNMLLIWQNHEDKALYFRTRNLIIDNLPKIEDEEKQVLIHSLVNYCNYNLKYFNDEMFIKEEFELNKISLTFLGKSKHELRNLEYYNILTRALELKELLWAQHFIQHCTKYVNDKENLRNYALSRLLFEKCKYEESIKCLSKVKPGEPFLKLQLKIDLLKLYYELNLTETAISCIESVRHFIVNSKEIGDSYRKSINEKVKIFVQLFDLKMNPEGIDDLSLRELKKSIGETSVTGRRWYMEKAGELESQLT